MKAFKSFTTLFLVILVVVSLCACSSKKDGKTTSNNNAESNTLKIEDIAWNVDEGIIDGERYALLNYSNNSKYTISGFEITFKEKAGLTDEEKEAFYKDIKEKYELTDEDMAELKEEDISMYVETEKIVNPGESIKNQYCYYYSGYFYVKDINHYNLVEPDIATIKYIDDNKIFTVYYDFTSEKYSVDDETEIAYQWSKTDLGNKIPKPEVSVVEVGLDDESTFMFDVHGMSIDQFDAYIEQCKDLGYTKDVNSFDGAYSANNNEGYNLDLYYDNDDNQMSVTVKAPAK